MTAEATFNGTPAPKNQSGTRREITRAQAVRRFKWTVLTPLIALMVFILMPAFFLQGYFSFFAFSIFDAGDNPGFASYFEASTWVGLDLWKDALSDDKFGYAIIRSLLFSSGVTVGCFLLGFGLALLMYRPFRLQGFYYVFFILPMLTVPIVIAYTGEMILYQNGPLNDILGFFTGTTNETSFLYNQEAALTTIGFMEIWNWTPFSFIIMMAGLASLPKEPIEAAQILGASRFRIFWEVQVPLLRPVILLALILRFLESMAEFPKTWGLLQGGPGSATETIPVYIFINAWQFFDISYGAVLSYLVLFMMVAIVMSAIWLLRREKKSLDAMYEARPQEG
jgi:multiple sugar transport system permease protein